MRRLDSRPIPSTPGEIRAFLPVRNEALRLPDNLNHHRGLGVSRFFVADNGSVDGTLEFLLAQPDVHLFRADQSFAASGFGMAWMNQLLDEYGCGHWTLTVDADELLIYPGIETVPLTRVCTHLDHLGAQGMFCMLLDMYADRPLNDVGYRAGDSLLAACPWFDPAPYRTVQVHAFPHIQIYGGVRERIFHFSASPAPHPPTISVAAATVPARTQRMIVRFIGWAPCCCPGSARSGARRAAAAPPGRAAEADRTASSHHPREQECPSGGPAALAESPIPWST